ncbi:unnamed protein product [Linum trigynum]|uniref:CCHC-type domain-containing protein n=1 Tax=Linum trigynum TaxID=586398 RepID=A0AAV2FA81_9ROSI
MIVWVQLPALKIHFYHKEVLMTIGNLIGRTIKLDYHTLNQQRAKFVRLAVEVDLAKQLVPRIWLDDAWQKVEYENLPKVCFHCGRIGHADEECREKRPTALSPAFTNLELAPTVAGTTEDPEEPNPGFGPWLLVTRRSGRNQWDGDRKGKSEDVKAGSSGGQALPGKHPKTGRETSLIAEKGISVSSSQMPKMMIQEKKVSNGKKKGDEGKKGKAKAHPEGSTWEKGLLGSGPNHATNQAFGPKATGNSSQQASKSSFPAAQPGLRSGLPGPALTAKQGSPSAQPTSLPPPPPTHTVIGPNGTQMEIVELHPAQSTPQNSPSARSRTKKSKNKKATPLRSPSKLLSTKALQVWTPKKDRKPKSKARLASLTLQEIDAWTKAAQIATGMTGEADATNRQREAAPEAVLEGEASQQND